VESNNKLNDNHEKYKNKLIKKHKDEIAKRRDFIEKMMKIQLNDIHFD